MILKRHFERLLLSPGDLEPLRDDFEVVGVFNPGAIIVGNEVILLVRVAERPRERRPGFTASPRWVPGQGLTIDWLPDVELDVLDPRVVRRKADGLVRLTFISHLRVVRCRDGRSVEEVTDVRFLPDSNLEEFGVEDPRITAIGDRFFFTYVAVFSASWCTVSATALASTTDFRSFDRHGVIFCPENKDVVLFPERIDGTYVALHRPNAATPFCRPEMWVARSPDLIHWGRHDCLPRRRAMRRVPLEIRPRSALGTAPWAGAARRRWLARNLPRKPPSDRARRGGQVLDRCPAPRPAQPGEGAPSHDRLDLRADRRFRASRLRSRRGFSHRHRRNQRLIPHLLRRGRFVHGGCRVFEGRCVGIA